MLPTTFCNNLKNPLKCWTCSLVRKKLMSKFCSQPFGDHISKTERSEQSFAIGWGVSTRQLDSIMAASQFFLNNGALKDVLTTC